MKVSVSFDDLRTEREKLAEPVGIVPTMGYLHEGHISLVRKAKEECASVVVTIFVNPTQFAPTEDLASYPRNIPGDLEMLQNEGVDLVWLPNDETMYPEGYQTYVNVTEVTKPLEGAKRPTHFKGVTTIVSKLFNAVTPQKAYFGQKDAQQAAVLKQMTKDLSYPIEIVVVPIMREESGLAMSSRNKYLSDEERKAADVLSRSLRMAEKAFKTGERSGEAIRKIMTDEIGAEPLAELEYVSCSDAKTLLELGEIEEQALCSMAVRIGKTRLIDNVVLGLEE
jgi:pantoate--beta-alanine ligase